MASSIDFTSLIDPNWILYSTGQTIDVDTTLMVQKLIQRKLTWFLFAFLVLYGVFYF